MNLPWLVPLAWHREIPSRCRRKSVYSIINFSRRVRCLNRLRIRPSSAQPHTNQRQALMAHQFVDGNGGRYNREYPGLDGRRLEGETVLPRDNHTLGSSCWLYKGRQGSATASC